MPKQTNVKAGAEKRASAPRKSTNESGVQEAEAAPAKNVARKGRAAKTVAAKGYQLSNGRANLRSKLKEQKQNFIQGQILEVAAELIAASGFRAVTIDDISATLGFSKSVIYYYLENKNDILWRIFGRIYEAYFEALEKITTLDAGPEKKMYEIVRLHATNVMTHRAWTAISLRDEAELDEKQRRQITRQKREYDAAIEKIYSEGVESGIFLDIPPHIAVAGLLGACNSIHTWYNPEGPLSAAVIADHYATMLANGFMRR